MKRDALLLPHWTLLFSLVVITHGEAQEPRNPLPQTPPLLPAGTTAFAVVGARVLVGEGTTIDGAVIVVRDGRIVSVVRGDAAPAGMPVIDAHGAVVTPGFVGLDEPIGLLEIDQEESTVDAAPEDGEDHVSIRAAFSAADGYNPRSTLVPVARLGGVTTALATPSGGLVAGTSAWVDLDGETPDVAIARPVVALHVDLDEPGVAAAGGARSTAIERLREALDDARLFARQQSAFDRRALREMRVTRADLIRLGDALAGRIPVVAHVSRADDIIRVLALAHDYGLHLVLAGAEEGWRVADRIHAANVPVIVHPLVNLPSRFSALGTRYDNAALLNRASVHVMLAVTTGEAHGVRNLRQEAGNAVANGLDPTAALRAITFEPAHVFGLERDYGSISAGKVADLCVWSGDPFELSTRLLHLVIRGRDVPLRSRQTELFERYRDLAALHRHGRR